MPKRGPWKRVKNVGPPLEHSSSEAPSSRDPRRNTTCRTCFDLDLRRIPQPHKDPNFCSYGQVARHWIKSADLAKNPSCPSCCFLKSAFDTLVNSGDVIDIPPGGRINYSIAILDRDDDDVDDDVTKRKKREAARSSETSRSLKIEMRCTAEKKGKKDEGFQEEFEVEIYTPPGSTPAPWNAVGTAGEVPTTLNAGECAAVIKPWLQDCDNNHASCKTYRSEDQQGELLPRRVLDLSEGQIRLVETTERQRGHYVALSHCWGKEQLMTTTRTTIADRMRGIPLEQMPKTFKDVIELTRGLGLRYIWIDSLCIIQQDKVDWEEQSAAMANIYARCYLNVATTRAAGGHEGCLGPRWTVRDSLGWAAQFSRAVGRGDSESDSEGQSGSEISKMRKCEVKSFRVPDTEQDICIRLAMKSSHEALQTPRWVRGHTSTAPLLLRAWVYQERSLSARSVHLHANEMVWACNGIQRCECKALDGTPPDGDGYGASKDRIATLDTLKDMKVLHGLWRTIVEDFTLLDLTYESDRLPALSGLAYRFAEHFPKNERYLAGLWEGDLARDLLWESGGSKQTAGPTRERSMTAPSWSWASLVWGGESASAIDWEYETKPKLAKWAGTKSYEQDHRTRIISASVVVNGLDKYGIVSSGSIAIEGPLCAVIIGKSSRPPAPLLIDVTTVKYNIFNSLHLNYDTPTSEASAGGMVYCLFIGSFSEIFDHDDEPHITHQGLILKPTSGGKFQRIGRWTQHIEDWVHNKDIWTRKSRVMSVEII